MRDESAIKQDLRQKLLMALNGLGEAEVPDQWWAFGRWANRVLPKELLDELEELEKIADTDVNEWWVEIMVESGLYESDSDGFVWKKVAKK